MAKKRIDLRKPKNEIRIGYDCMEPYIKPSDLKTDYFRFYFKGRVVVFAVAARKQHEIDGLRGMLFEIITDSPRANIWYEAFQRSDGVCFFLGESEKQSVAKNTRTLAYRSADKFN